MKLKYFILKSLTYFKVMAVRERSVTFLILNSSVMHLRRIGITDMSQLMIVDKINANDTKTDNTYPEPNEQVFWQAEWRISDNREGSVLKCTRVNNKLLSEFAFLIQLPTPTPPSFFWFCFRFFCVFDCSFVCLFVRLFLELDLKRLLSVSQYSYLFQVSAIVSGKGIIQYVNQCISSPICCLIWHK